MGRACAALLGLLLLATAPAALAAKAHGDFVVREGAQLYHKGKPYRFTGMNVYNANSVDDCWYTLGEGPLLAQSLDQMGPGVDVIRAWFFQGFAVNGIGQRDWSRFDHTLAVAREQGVRVIVTLTNQWLDCDLVEGFKTAAWYQTGYRQAPAGYPASYRDFVAEVVTRYRRDPTVLMWQLANEAEVSLHTPDGLCAPEAHGILKSWAADVSSLIKSIDRFHLVSLGTIGSGQCGAQFTDYKSLHDIATIDLCEFHDYGTEPMPGDQWNGLAFRLQQCAELGKPLFIGETGINPQWLDGTLAARAALFDAKLSTQFGAGVAGIVLWAWNAFGSSTEIYDIGPGDPVLDVLAGY